MQAGRRQEPSSEARLAQRGVRLLAQRRLLAAHPRALAVEVLAQLEPHALVGDLLDLTAFRDPVERQPRAAVKSPPGGSQT